MVDVDRFTNDRNLFLLDRLIDVKMIPNPFSAQPPVLIDLTEDSSSELRFKPRTKDSLNAEIQLVGDTIQVCLKIKDHILNFFSGDVLFRK